MNTEDFLILSKVLLEVNTELTYQTDREQYGVDDKWVTNPVSKRGDCEDFALSMLSRLVRDGIYRRRCSIYLVYTDKGQYHAVLVVDGEYVLENTVPFIQSWKLLSKVYKFDREITPN